jgi:hypothetical protein
MAKSTGARVISLSSHRARRLRTERDEALRDAMRRHPSYQGALLRGPGERKLAAVVPIDAH